MVGNHFGTLTLDLSNVHNLCFQYLNCKMQTTSIIFSKKIQQYEKVQFGQDLVKIQLVSLRSASLWFPRTYTSCKNVFTFLNWIHSTYWPPFCNLILKKTLCFLSSQKGQIVVH